MNYNEYTPEQMNEIEVFISERYKGSGYVAHEMESEYVHTDVYISEDDETRSFVTFGMGAAKMNAPVDPFERIELIMHSSLDTDVKKLRMRTLLCGLVSLTKYPFINNTWFGMGHTVRIPRGIEEEFGYEYALFAPTSHIFSPEDKTGGVKGVIFLDVIPIYKDEREWIMNNDSFVYLDLLYDKFGDDMYKVDLKREHYIPSEEDLLVFEEDVED